MNQALAILAALGIVAGGGFLLGMEVKQGQWDAATVEAQKSARNTEDLHNQEVANIRSNKDAEIASINARLADALSLRNRPQRLPETARKACEGSTGRELSRQDADVLERLAADAETQRSALKECYAWVDALGSAE